MCRDERSRRQLAARERCRGDQRDRRGGHRHEQRGDQVGVGEGRRPAGPEAAREAVGDHVQPLEREGQRDAFGDRAQAAAGASARPAEGSAAHERIDGDPERDRAVHGEAPAERVDAMPDERTDRRDARDRAGEVAECGRRVVVERGERTRGETRIDLCSGRAREPGQQHRRARARLGAVGEEACDRVGCRHPHRDGRRERHRERDRPRAELPPEPPGGLRPCEVGKHHHPERARDQQEREIDPVGGEEAVGRRPVAELPRQDGARNSGRAAHGRRREPGQEPASDRAPPG